MLTADQILALSPDDSSAKSAKGLLSPAKWPTLGYTEAAIWGECQGSGSKPYQVIIDVGGPSFKCTCPSRKFPCKHGLALYLLLAQKQSAFTSKELPTWVAEWLKDRQVRAEKQAEKKESKVAVPAGPEVAAKREAKRLDRMIGGARDLERWMADLVRHGIADLPTKPVNFWREVAARLVDAQASGLGHAVRQLEATVSSGEGWQQSALMQMGRMQLLTDAMQRLDTLPEPLRQDVRAFAGWPSDKEDVLAAGDCLEDTWLVQGVSYDEHEKLWERRVWLCGLQSQRQAFLLDFSHGQRRYDHGFVPGMAVKAKLAFFPSAYPLRALLTNVPQSIETNVATSEAHSWDSALDSIATALGSSPWMQRLPLMLHGATPISHGNRWFVLDTDLRAVPLRISEEDGWQLLALSGGHPLSIFGEWLGDRWRPLTAWSVDESTPCWTEAVVLA